MYEQPKIIMGPTESSKLDAMTTLESELREFVADVCGRYGEVQRADKPNHPHADLQAAITHISKAADALAAKDAEIKRINAISQFRLQDLAGAALRVANSAKRIEELEAEISRLTRKIAKQAAANTRLWNEQYDRAETAEAELSAARAELAGLREVPDALVKKAAIRFGEIYLRNAERVTVYDLQRIEVAMRPTLKHALKESPHE